MKIFKNKLANRLAISKGLGFLIGLLAFFFAPYVFPGVDIYLRLALLFWYTTFGVFIGLIGIFTKHPVFKWFKMPWWFRGAIMGAWLNFVIALFMYDTLGDLMIGTMFELYSPFRLILEGIIVGFVIDGLSTRYAGDGKKLFD